LGGDQEIYFWDGSFPIVPIQITNNSEHDGSAAISGSNVVWLSWDGNDLEVYFWDGSFPIVPIQITNNSTADKYPAISGSNVVWSQCDDDVGFQCPVGDYEIYFWDGSFPIVPIQVTNNSINDTNPAISGSKVVWEGSEDVVPVTATNLYFWDGSFPITPIQVTDNSTLDWRPDISGSTVVWVGWLDGRSEILRWDGSFPIVPTAITDDVRGEWAPAISGSNVVWEYHPVDDYEIYFWDGVTTTNVSNNRHSHDEYPDISGSTVVWEACVWDSYVGCVEDDEIYLTTVPEPSFPLLMGSGLIGLAALNQRRKNKGIRSVLHQ
jgi:hypothetical protein